MPRATRRRLLQAAGAGVTAGQTGSIAGLLAMGRAPAYAQQTSPHWLRWHDFVPASGQLLIYAKIIQGTAPKEAVRWAHG